jgi:hypothetical protein
MFAKSALSHLLLTMETVILVTAKRIMNTDVQLVNVDTILQLMEYVNLWNSAV